MSDASQNSTVEDLLTVIVTTSPTPSAPSTELLSSVLESFQTHCPALLRCRVIVVLDAYEQIGARSRLKKGYVTAETAQKYTEYKARVKALFLDRFCPAGTELTESSDEAEYGSATSTTPVPLTVQTTRDGRVSFVEAACGRRLGFALAVRSALRVVGTRFVWVHQHDWALTRDIPVGRLVGVMMAADPDGPSPIQYVCLLSSRLASYATSEHVMPHPELRKLASALTGDYGRLATCRSLPTKTATETTDGGDLSGTAATSAALLPLTPMFFWHDKPHVASTAHYLERVFPTRLAVMRGAFIEDTIGQRARTQMKQGLWAKWATWLYYPEDGKVACLRHLHGRTWRGEEEEGRYRCEAIRRGRAQGGGRRSGAVSGV